MAVIGKLCFLALFLLFSKINAQDLPSCDSFVYCQGPLLDVVQKAKLFEDSKTFVDQRMLYDEKTVLNNFQELMYATNDNPSRDQVKKFVDSNFADGDEWENWISPDYNENPSFLERISNTTLRKFAQDIVKIWPTLARKIKPEVIADQSRYSLIPLPNGVIIPGGRFKEIYYWDSFWIIKGLIISEMPKTAQGMLENCLYLVSKYGFIPNGSRVYYLNRSHPPLLTSMVRLLMDSFLDVPWLKKYIGVLEKELKFFILQRSVTVLVDNELYTLAHYNSRSPSPRPESYSEDIDTCESLKEDHKIRECYMDIKSAAETGWDFSFRWVFDESGGNNANRTYTQTRRILPVDLNSILARAFLDLAELYLETGNTKKYSYWHSIHTQWKMAIHQVLYNQDRGMWFDYDIQLGKHRDYFYPSNIAPLWAEIYSPESAQLLGRNAYQYLMEQNITKYFGGIPTSFNNTGEQWDYPSAWAPLQSIIIQGLHRSAYGKAQQLAHVLAERWINANLIGFQQTGKMYEKYDAEHPGENGGGGEYEPQTGFGWTNGVALELLTDFFSAY